MSNQNNGTIRRGGRELPPGWKKEFLKALRKTAVVSRARKVARVGRTTVYEYYKKDPKFAARWDEALEEAIDELEYVARRICIEGVQKPVFFKDKQIATIREYPTSLMQFLLRCYRREKFGDVPPPITDTADKYLLRLSAEENEKLLNATIPPGAIPSLPREEDKPKGDGSESGGGEDSS